MNPNGSWSVPYVPPKAPWHFTKIPDYPGDPWVYIWARPFARASVRLCVRKSGCRSREGWGILNRKFAVTGTLEQLNLFLDWAWSFPDMRKSMMEALFSEGLDDDAH